jgi:SAM-dependent methyltransferase
MKPAARRADRSRRRNPPSCLHGRSGQCHSIPWTALWGIERRIRQSSDDCTVAEAKLFRRVGDSSHPQVKITPTLLLSPVGSQPRFPSLPAQAFIKTPRVVLLVHRSMATGLWWYEALMRDVVTGFYVDVLERIIASGTIAISDSVLVVCGGPLDEAVIKKTGFADFTITNLDSGMANHRQDAENLTYENGSFDIVIVHAGLHHCHSPHRAMLEMYRVARKCVVAFESRDSLMMRAAVRLGLTDDYELDSISSDRKRGGVADTGIPNFVFRWTERDVRKAIASYDPSFVPQIQFFYDLRIPIQRFTQTGNNAMRVVGLLIEPLSKLFAAVAPKQCNEFAFAISKAGIPQPWISDNPHDVVSS